MKHMSVYKNILLQIREKDYNLQTLDLQQIKKDADDFSKELKNHILNPNLKKVDLIKVEEERKKAFIKRDKERNPLLHEIRSSSLEQLKPVSEIEKLDVPVEAEGYQCIIL